MTATASIPTYGPLLHRDPGMSAMISKHDIIADLIPPDRPVIYLDYPIGVNVGDLLIMLGTLAFFKRHGLKMKTARNSANTEARGVFPVKDGETIVLQGGGNFGDLYPHIQRYRERIASEYPENQIVIMPQTIFFQDPDELKRSAERLTKHANLTLIVRDQVSFDLAVPYFGERLRLAPDMAHQLWPSLREKVVGTGDLSTRGPLFFMRVDEEQSEGYPALDAEASAFVDWRDVVTKRLRVVKRLYVEAGRVQSGLNIAVTPNRLYFSLIEKEIIRIARVLNQKSPWVTSRLHGFILGILLDKPVVAFDNSYGKLSSYIETWRSSISPIAFVQTEAGATMAVDFATSARTSPHDVSWEGYEDLVSRLATRR